MAATTKTLQKRSEKTADPQLPANLYSHGGLCEFLRHKFPHSTFYAVEAAAGVPAGTVEGWFSREYRPSLPHFLRLMSAFGPAFVRAALVVDVDWLVEADRQARLQQINAEIARLQAEKSGFEEFDP